MSWEIHAGDCIAEMRKLDEGSVDAVVTDPPYGIGFMGHEWDQPGEFAPIGPDEEVPLQAGKRRRRQPSPESGAGHARDRVPLNGHGRREGVKFGGPTGADNTQHTVRGGAMHAGRYDLSLTANRRYQAWCEAWAREAFRVLKPGGHLLACGGSRTHHRLASGIEDAGFEIRDRIDTPDGRTVLTPDGTLAWYFGSGFPKSADIHKMLCKWARRVARAWIASPYGSDRADARRRDLEANVEELNDPVEDAEWQGWGTALKPAHEPIVVARKPLVGTVAENVLEHGTGGLNIDACRIMGVPDAPGTTPATANGNGATHGEMVRSDYEVPAGRWPANVVLGEGAALELDAQSGERPHSFRVSRDPGHAAGELFGHWSDKRHEGYGDSGGASRFFYCAKTSRAERNAGLDGFAAKAINWSSGEKSPGTFQSDGTEREQRNFHPTVKPINLMRWLVRMVTPPGGIVLDPFLGSGSTGCAAVLEGFDFIGIERKPEYVAIAEARIAFWSQHVGEEVEDVLGIVGRSQRESKALADLGQGSLLELHPEDQQEGAAA